MKIENLLMMKCFLKFITITILFTQFFTSNFALAVSDSVNISLEVTICNFNGICEPELGENYENCPSDCPAPVPPAPPGGIPVFDTTPPVIFNLFISKITLNSATISWETNEQALCQLFWGKTYEYKEEAISETAFYREHIIEISNLSPSTTYHFKIACKDTSQNEAETRDQRFTTLTPPDITPPANVSDFEAIPGDKQITLTWINPPNPDFKAVKIMRSEKFYPSDPWEGVPVYNDKGTSFVDTGLTNGVRYYYTAFAYDKSGNYASGAVVSAVPREPWPPPVEIFGCTDPSALNYNPEATIDDGSCEFPLPPPEIEKITLEDFDFILKEEKVPLIEKKIIETEAEEPFDISLNYEKVPEVLKTVMVTLEKENKFFSFLLRINKEKTAYQATILSPQEAGVYPLTISILDYKNQTLKKIYGLLRVEKKPEIPPVKISWYKKTCFWKWILLILLLISLTILIRYILRKDKKKKIFKKRINTNL